MDKIIFYYELTLFCICGMTLINFIGERFQ